MKNVFAAVLLIVIFGCDSKDAKVKTASTTTSDTIPKKKFEMYAMSEMSLLMEQMYVDNERLKSRIIKGDTIGKFPNHFLEIHKAVMTDSTENDEFFKAQAANFIKAQELIYKDPNNAKTHFNKGVDACIKCHEVKCGGPIPRIRKLYIE